MNYCQWTKEHSGLCEGRNLQKGALRNELLINTLQPKRKYFLLNVPYPVIYRTLLYLFGYKYNTNIQCYISKGIIYCIITAIISDRV